MTISFFAGSLAASRLKSPSWTLSVVPSPTWARTLFLCVLFSSPMRPSAVATLTEITLTLTPGSWESTWRLGVSLAETTASPASTSTCRAVSSAVVEPRTEPSAWRLPMPRRFTLTLEASASALALPALTACTLSPSRAVMVMPPRMAALVWMLAAALATLVLTLPSRLTLAPPPMARPPTVAFAPSPLYWLSTSRLPRS